MEFRTIRQTSKINGINRNPGVTEHMKCLVYNDNIKFIEYLPYLSGKFDTKTTDGIVNKGDDSLGPKYVWKLDNNKNPMWRKEDFLVSVTKVGTGVVLTMNDSATKTIPLGSLAWLNSIENTITLPGDKKILFDNNGEIGGSETFKFNYNTNTLDLTNFVGIQAKNGIDSSFNGVFQYLGNKNTLISHGITRPISWGSNMEGNLLSGNLSGGSLISGSWNTVYGNYAASNISNNVSGMVAVGAYAGRLEQDGNKFYIGNTNYSTLEDGRNLSLFYGDFSQNWVRINNRLEVPQEVRIGTFNVSNTPLWGMNQFIEIGTSGVYKPQYYDGTNWVDYAVNANNYLVSVTKATSDVGTTSNDFKVTFVRNGLDNLTLQLGSNAFNSTIIPHAIDNGFVGYLQISSGTTNDTNRGFTAQAGLQWVSAKTELKVPGGISLANRPKYSTTDNVIIATSGHYYGSIGSKWIQLDNNEAVGEANTANNIGLAGYGLFYEKNSLSLDFKNINSNDPRIILDDNDEIKTIDFILDLLIGGQNNPIITTTTTSANVFDSVLTPEGVNPRMKFRPLISSDGSIQFATTGDNEIDVTVAGITTGVGKTYYGENIGGEIGIYKEIDAATFKFKTISDSGQHITVGADEGGETVYVNAEDIVLSNLGTGSTSLSLEANTYHLTQKTFIDGVATTVVVTENDITFNVNKSIPAITYTPTPVFVVGGTPGQGVLNLKANYSADIRTTSTLAATTLHTINIGSGLFYNSTTNTLTSTSAGGSSTDYRLTDIRRGSGIDSSTLTFVNTDEYGSGAEQHFEYTFGALAFLNSIEIPIATYIDNVSPHIGGVTINKSMIGADVANYQALTLNEVTGELEFTLDTVLYTPTNDMHDGLNLTRRAIARENIAAAFVNGDAVEDFVADKVECETLIVNQNATIQNVQISGSTVTTDNTVPSVELSKQLDPDVAATRVEVKAGEVNIYVNPNQGSGNVNFYSVTDDGTTMRTAFLDSSGNFHLKGQLIARDTSV